MARFLVVEFDDNTDADAFAEQFNKGTVFYLQADGNYGPFNNEKMRIRALFATPTVFCTCVRGKQDGWTKGRKYGWWVHDKCGKPSKAWATGERWGEALGRNLLNG